jgi:hypothetical protein
VRRVVFLLLCTSVSLVGLAPVSAAEPVRITKKLIPQLAPGAPRSLVSKPAQGGRAVRVSWKPPASSGSASVASYRVAITPGSGLRHSGRVTVAARTTHTSFGNLAPGRSYHVTVRTLSAAGLGPSASADYLAARKAPAWVFATNTTTGSVARVWVRGTRVMTIAPSGTAWAVNTEGDVYVIDREARTVSRTTARGQHTSVIASGLAGLSDVQLDAAGQVYVLAGRQVVRMSATGARRRVVANPASGSVLVRSDGRVITTAGDAETTPLQIVSYPPGGGAPSVRTLPGLGSAYPAYRRGLMADSAGNLFLYWVSNGGGDFEWWFRVAAGSTTETPHYTRMAHYALAVGTGGRSYLAQTGSYCDTIAMAEGVCTPDLTVRTISRYAADGTRTSIPIQPFVYDQWGLDDGSALAVDRAGRLFVAQASGPSAGLRAYAATGGAATVLAAGTFADVVRNN